MTGRFDLPIVGRIEILAVVMFVLPWLVGLTTIVGALVWLVVHV